MCVCVGVLNPPQNLCRLTVYSKVDYSNTYSLQLPWSPLFKYGRYVSLNLDRKWIRVITWWIEALFTAFVVNRSVSIVTLYGDMYIHLRLECLCSRCNEIYSMSL